MQVPADWFRDWFDSPYYHRLYFGHDTREAEAFIGRLLDFLKPPPGARMLDVACGKGRHSRILAARGFDVTGIDLAANSIKEAQKSENDHLHFYVHDMRLPFRINYFDCAFNFFTSFGYFRTEREHYNAIRSIAQTLHPGGSFVLDYLNVRFTMDHFVHRQEKQIDGVTYLLNKWYDETHFYKKIVIEDEQLKAPLEYIEKVARFTLGDFNDMFSYHHLQVQEVFGDYALHPFDIVESPRLILVARKVVNPMPPSSYYS